MRREGGGLRSIYLVGRCVMNTDEGEGEGKKHTHITTHVLLCSLCLSSYIKHRHKRTMYVSSLHTHTDISNKTSHFYMSSPLTPIVQHKQTNTVFQKADLGTIITLISGGKSWLFALNHMLTHTHTHKHGHTCNFWERFGNGCWILKVVWACE